MNHNAINYDLCVQVIQLAMTMTPATRADWVNAGGGGFSEDVDLNAVSPEALDAAKAKMDERFNAHRKVLGDEDFVYDVRREFQPSRPCEWDSDSEDGEADDVMALLP
jgi:hypothetical protein